MTNKRAVILLSGGLDSATVLASARAQGYDCYTMRFDYGQRHRSELDASRRILEALGAIEHKVIGISVDGIGGSALTDRSLGVPDTVSTGEIQITYVLERRNVLLYLAL